MKERFYSHSDRSGGGEKPSPIESSFWKGNDFAVAETTIIPARRPQLARVTIDPTNLFSKDPAIIARLNATMRSGLAMRGAEISEFGKQVVRFTEVNGIDIGKEPFEAVVVMDNYAERDLIIPSGERIARPFFEGSQSAVEGNELVALVKSGDVQLGEEGKDWEYRRHNGIKTGAFVKISKENRKWFARSDAPIIYSKSAEPGDRSRLAKLLVPVPMGIPRNVLWIGETQSKIHLSPNVHAVLHTAVINTVNGKPQVAGAHINSRVLDGGRTDWEVRVEILSSTIPERMPDYVYMTFVREQPTAA